MSQLEKQMQVVCSTVNRSGSNSVGTDELLMIQKPQHYEENEVSLTTRKGYSQLINSVKQKTTCSHRIEIQKQFMR